MKVIVACLKALSQPGVLKETMKNLSQGGLFLVWDLNTEPPEYKGHLQSSWTYLIILSWNLWRCSDGLFSEIPPLASNALLTTLHPLLKNVNRVIMLHSKPSYDH